MSFQQPEGVDCPKKNTAIFHGQHDNFCPQEQKKWKEEKENQKRNQGDSWISAES